MLYAILITGVLLVYLTQKEWLSEAQKLFIKNLEESLKEGKYTVEENTFKSVRHCEGQLHCLSVKIQVNFDEIHYSSGLFFKNSNICPNTSQKARDILYKHFERKDRKRIYDKDEL